MAATAQVSSIEDNGDIVTVCGSFQTNACSCVNLGWFLTSPKEGESASRMLLVGSKISPTPAEQRTYKDATAISFYSTDIEGNFMLEFEKLRNP